jgi:hypothetical protein
MNSILIAMQNELRPLFWRKNGFSFKNSSAISGSGWKTFDQNSRASPWLQTWGERLGAR